MENKSVPHRHETYEELQHRAQVCTDELAVAIERVRQETTLRKHLETRLTEVDMRHSSWIETSETLIWSIDAQRRWIFVSAAAREFFGCEPSTMIGKPFADYFYSERAADDSRFLEELEKGIPRFRYETIHVRENGSKIRLRLNAVPLFDAQGTFIAAMGTAADVSHTRTGEARFRRLLEAVPDAMVILGERSDIVLANEQTQRLFGYRSDELLGKSIDLLVPEKLGQRHSELREQFLRNPDIRPIALGVEFIGRHSSGKTFPLEVSLSPLETGDNMLVIAAIRDISSHKQYEIALRESKQRLQLIADAFPVLIAYVNSELRYEFNNAAYTTWFGLPLEEFKDRFVRDVIGEQAFELVKDKYTLALSGQVTEFECWIPYKYGGERHVRATFIPHFASPSQVVGFFASIVDITNQKRMEESAHRTEQLISLGNLTAGIAHEINNPICAARTAAEVAIMCRDKPNADGMVQECLTTILDSIKRCDQIVKNVLRISRDTPSEKTPHDINDIIRHANAEADKYFVLRGVAVCVQLEAGSLVAEVNRLDIELVLVNLIHNAVTASDPGTMVTIRTNRLPQKARIAIQDRGCGISPEKLARVFEPYYSERRDGSGAGLGLSLVDKIVREHGGTVTVQSKLGAGTTFTVELPLLDAEPAV